jgi:hypothetical protein
MPSNDLRSIPDLHDRQRRALAGELKITTFRALAHADRREIHRAMRHLKPRPGLEQIARWQDHARSGLKEAAMDRSDWHPAASFAVVFARRQVDGGWENRIEVERTEVEPEEERRIWPGWDGEGICGWMCAQVPGGAGPEAEPEPGAEEEAEKAPARVTGPAAASAAENRERPQLRISKITVSGPVATAGVDVADSAVTTPPVGPAEPPRIEISVSGARHDQEIHAVAQVLHPGEYGWNRQDPVVIRGAGVASFDVSGLSPGPQDLTLVAWAPDGTAQPALEELTIALY